MMNHTGTASPTTQKQSPEVPTVPVPMRGRVNKAPPPGYLDPLSLDQPAPAPSPPPVSRQPQQQQAKAQPPTSPASSSTTEETEKKKDDDTNTTNDQDADIDDGDYEAPADKPKKKGRRIGQSRSGKAVCCCDLQEGVVSMGFFNCVLAFIAVIIYGFGLSAHRESLCYQLGLGFSILFIVIAIFLIFGGMNRSPVLCIIFLASSWLAFIAAIIVLFVLADCASQRNWLLLTPICCGFLFKIYEGVVVYFFIKEPPPPPGRLRQTTTYHSRGGYPLMYTDSPPPIFIPYGGYGYGYHPYGYGGYGYGYDPALGMMAGMGLGMAMGGGFDHCGYDSCAYDSCAW